MIEKNIIIEDDALRDGFTQIPNAVLKNNRICPQARLLYGILLSYGWQKNTCFPGLETLADDIGVSSRMIQKYIEELKSSGLVEVVRRGLGKTNLYILKKIRNSDTKLKSYTDTNHSSEQKANHSSWEEYEEEKYTEEEYEESIAHTGKKSKNRKSEKNQKPYLDDMIAYCEEMGESRGIDPEQARQIAMNAYQYYEAGNWTDSRGKPVRNWKQKILAVWLKPEQTRPEKKLDVNYGAEHPAEYYEKMWEGRTR